MDMSVFETNLSKASQKYASPRECLPGVQADTMVASESNQRSRYAEYIQVALLARGEKRSVMKSDQDAEIAEGFAFNAYGRKRGLTHLLIPATMPHNLSMDQKQLPGWTQID